MRILVIDNNIDRPYWGAWELARFGRLASGSTIHVRRAPQEDLPNSPQSFDRIMISGSRTAAMDDAPWIFRLHEFIAAAIDQGKPVLGVCYGHQSLARVLGGKTSVRRAAVPELGWGKVELLADSELTRGLPREFHTYQSHFDEVSELPPGTAHLARSERCAIQAMRLVNKPVFGIQFHPEKLLDEGEISLELKNKQRLPHELLNFRKGRNVFDAAIGETLFRNFLGL